MSEAARMRTAQIPSGPLGSPPRGTILREVEAEAGAAASLEALGAVSAPVTPGARLDQPLAVRIGTDELAARRRTPAW